MIDLASIDWLVTAGVAMAFLAGGIVKGVISIGLPLVALPLLLLVVDVKTAIALMMVSLIVSNLLQALEGPGTMKVLRRFAPLIIPLVVGTLIGTTLFAILSQRTLELTIGPAVIVFTIASYLHPNLSIPPQSERWLGPLIGFGSGVIGGMTTFFGPILAAYVVGLGLTRDAFVKSISLIYVCASSSLLAGGVTHGYAGPKLLIFSALAMVPVYLGMSLGRIIRKRTDPERFRLLVLVVVCLSGANMIRLGLGY
jgi:uncharacterized membrane protein YfcA